MFSKILDSFNSDHSKPAPTCITSATQRAEHQENKSCDQYTEPVYLGAHHFTCSRIDYNGKSLNITYALFVNYILDRRYSRLFRKIPPPRSSVTSSQICLLASN